MPNSVVSYTSVPVDAKLVGNFCTMFSYFDLSNPLPRSVCTKYLCRCCLDCIGVVVMSPLGWMLDDVLPLLLATISLLLAGTASLSSSTVSVVKCDSSNVL